MTPEERTKLKEDIKKIITEHLDSIGFPDISVQTMMDNTQAMWIKICDAGLYREGMTFEGFVNAAYEHAMIAQILGVARMHR